MKRIVSLILFVCLFFTASGQSVGVVLSGGGAKGLSHIGVIKALEENGIPIDYICGTSMGAVIASMYAIGMSPGEMLDMVRSEEFRDWSSGKQREGYASRFYSDAPSPEMLRVALQRKPGGLKISLPSSLVSPYPMDLAMVEVYASPSVAAGYNFSNFMVPFFCISADVKNKRKVVHTSGNLGSAVRASMSYPFIFKPITVDSTVLFDGGFYDNFPWRELERLYSPDIIIGAKCVTGDVDIDDENLVGQITNMIVSPSDYDIPLEKGIVIAEKYPYGVMEFDKVDEIVAQGYSAAIKRIEEINGRVERRRSRRELDSMRLEFGQKCRKVYFAPEIEFEGNLNEKQKSFVSATIKGKSSAPFDFNTLKRGYYKMASTGLLKTFYPSYAPLEDSLISLSIKATAASELAVSIGGNISSAHLNQGYAGISWSHFGRTPWKIGLEGNIGNFYRGGALKWRHNIGTAPLMCYDMELSANRFSYYAQDITIKELCFGMGAATTMDEDGNLLLKANMYLGRSIYDYLPDKAFRSVRAEDRTSLSIFSPSLTLEKNTLDFPVYPTEGVFVYLGARWNRIVEKFSPGEVSIMEYGRLPQKGKSHNALRLSGGWHSYAKLGSRLGIGYGIDFLVQETTRMQGYIPTLLSTPAYNPFPHSATMLLKSYRADSYVGIGISPVIYLAKTLFLYGNISYFQPYRQIYEKQGGEYGYSGTFPAGAFLGSAALVWRMPFGPVSFSANWYQKGEEHRWYPQLSIGFLLFKKRILDD